MSGILDWAGDFVYYVLDLLVESTETSPAIATTFEKNLLRLSVEINKSDGPTVAIVGQSGAGKSSLLWSLSGSIVNPRPKIGLETDATDWSKRTDADLLSYFENMTFVDVPGYGTEAHPSEVMSKYFPFSVFSLILFVLCGKLRNDDEVIFRQVIYSGRPFAIVRSRSEDLDDSERRRIRVDIRKRMELPGTQKIWFVSSRTQMGLSTLQRWLFHEITAYTEAKRQPRAG